MNITLIEKIVLAYLEKHPELLERLVEALLNSLLAHLDKPAST